VADETGSTPGYTIEDAAAELKIPPDQVRDLIAAGVLTATGEGDALQVTKQSVVMYMLSRATADIRKITEPARPVAVASAAFLPLLLGMWFMAACVEVFSLQAHKPIVPAPAAVAVLGAVLALCWWLALQADEFSSAQGLGTTLYGRRMTPEGRVGTQWLILAGVPLLPLRSYVILEAGEPTANWSGMIRKTNYRLRALGRVYWPQALPVLGGVWAALGALVALAVRG
jgi:hypothetical protein